MKLICKKCKYLFPETGTDYYRCHIGGCPALSDDPFVKQGWIKIAERCYVVDEDNYEVWKSSLTEVESDLPIIHQFLPMDRILKDKLVNVYVIQHDDDGKPNDDVETRLGKKEYVCKPKKRKTTFKM